jgi:hypothetical protein
MTLDELTCLRDDLKRAIYSGVLLVRFGEREIRYQSREEMSKALSDLNAEIANFGVTPSRSMSNFTRFNG